MMKKFITLFFLFSILLLSVFPILKVSATGPGLYEHFYPLIDYEVAPTRSDWFAQTFTTNDTWQSCLYIHCDPKPYAGSPGPYVVSIRATDANGMPTGVDLAGPVSNITWSYPAPMQFYFSNPYTLVPNTKYAIVIRSPLSDNGNHADLRGSFEDGYSGGAVCESADAGSTWSLASGDFWFDVWGAVSNVPTWSNLTWSSATNGSSCAFGATMQGYYMLSKYVFSTNNTGSWMNDTAVAFSSSPQTVTVSKTLNSVAWNTVSFEWYFNDSAGNWAVTNMENFTLYPPNYPLVLSNLVISTYNCVPNALLTFTGDLYYQGTSNPPPDGDYNVQVLLSGLSVAVDHSLVGGGFSVSANAAGSAGTYTYSVSAVGASNANFGTVAVGYYLAVSMNGAYGTVSPASGLYNLNAVVSVLASANPSFSFDHWLVDWSYLRYDNPHSITMDADHAIEAFFITSGLDTAAPTFGNITANVTGAGFAVKLSCAVQDNVGLGNYSFSWNNTGVWVNQTVVSVSGASVQAQLSGVWNGTIGNVVSVKVYANDSSNNVGVSVTTNFLLTDGVLPTWTGDSVNSTVAGSVALFSALWSDNVNVSGYVFESNLTGAFVNSTWVPFTVFFSSTSAYSNVSAVLSGVVGSMIGFQFFCNDTANNWVGSGLQYFVTGGASTFAILFRQAVGGLVYVNGALTGDNVTLTCASGSTLSLAAVASSGYVFSGFSWTGGNSAVSPASFVVSVNDSVWTFFSVVSVPSGPSGPSSGGVSSVVHVQDGSVSVVQGGSATFELVVSWTGGGSLTVSVVQGGGNFSGWISCDSLPKSDSSGVLHLTLTCSVPAGTVPTSYSVPVSLTVQTVSGGSVVSGVVDVSVSYGAGQLSFLEEVMTWFFILVAVAVGGYGFLSKYFP